MVILTGNESFGEITAIFQAPKGMKFLLTKNVLTQMLERYASGDLDRQQIFEMCDALEWRDNVQYEEDYEEVIGQALFRMATPRHANGTDWIDVPRLREELQHAQRS